MSSGYIPRGTIPANLCPFTPDYQIDEPELRRHLEWLATTPGVTAVTTNGHAAEVSALNRAERQKVLDITVDAVAGRVKVVTGIFADGTAQAVEYARDARSGGADALLVFPPATFEQGSRLRPEMALRHHAAISDAVDLPIIAFAYPKVSGSNYSPETLVKLTDAANVVAVKDWSMDILAFEDNLRALRATGKPISILSSFSASLLPSLVLGADGILSGNGTVIADLQAQLLALVQSGDLFGAQRLYERLYPMTQVFYKGPILDMHNRMKEALVMLGRLERAVVRPPLLPISEADRAEIRAALVKGQLLPEPVER